MTDEQTEQALKALVMPKELMEILLKAANDHKEYPWIDDVTPRQIEEIITAYVIEMRKYVMTNGDIYGE